MDLDLIQALYDQSARETGFFEWERQGPWAQETLQRFAELVAASVRRSPQEGETPPALPEPPLEEASPSGEPGVQLLDP